MQLRTCLSALAITTGILFCGVNSAAEPVHPQVELKTNLGTVILELYPDAAPKTVKNFLQYVKSGFYNGTIFHRVIDNFMIQGGGMGKDLKDKKRNPTIPLEAQLAFDHGLKNDIGTIAMAREEKPDTANSEFFINVADNDFLNPSKLPDGDPVTLMRRGTERTMPRAQAQLLAAGYAPFGRVIDGMAVINKIKVLQTTPHGEHLNVPINTVTILSAKVLKVPVVPKTIEQQLNTKPVEPTAPVQADAPAQPATTEAAAPAQTN